MQNIFGAHKNYYNDFKICMRDIVKAVESSKKKLRNTGEKELSFNT